MAIRGGLGGHPVGRRAVRAGVRIFYRIFAIAYAADMRYAQASTIITHAGVRTVISPDSAFQLLEPHFPSFRAIVQQGWRFWSGLPPEARLVLDIRAQRCVVWCGMDDAAKLLFREEPRVTIVPGVSTTFFNVDDRAIVRFKKLDATGASSNLPTQLQLGLRDPQISFAGPLGDLPTLDVGYVPNDTETGYTQVLVAALSVDRVAWKFPVPDGPAAAIELPVEVTTPTTVLRTDVPVRVDRNAEAGKV